MKKFSWLCLFLIVILSATLAVGCKNNPPAEMETPEQMKANVDAAMDAVMLANNVTNNIELPATSGMVAISWSSDKTDIIGNTGAVSRPAFGQNDVEVKLTGSFTYKDYSDTKVYTITVKAVHEKVFTFAGGYTGDNKIFTTPENGTLGTVVDKGEGVVTLKPAEEGAKNGPCFDIAPHMPAFRNTGYTIEALIYLDRQEMFEGENTFAIDFSLSNTDSERLGGVMLNFTANDTNVMVSHNQSQNSEEERFAALTGWYTVGVKYTEKDGKLSAKTFVNNADGTEAYAWTSDKFVGFDIDETTGEHEDIALSLVGAPRSMCFVDMNINGVDLKKVTLKYNVVL